MIRSWEDFKATVGILVTMVLVYGCLHLWVFAWTNFFTSTIALPTMVLATFLTVITLVLGGASFSHFLGPIVAARKAAREATISVEENRPCNEAH